MASQAVQPVQGTSVVAGGVPPMPPVSGAVPSATIPFANPAATSVIAAVPNAGPTPPPPAPRRQATLIGAGIEHEVVQNPSAAELARARKALEDYSAGMGRSQQAGTFTGSQWTRGLI